VRRWCIPNAGQNLVYNALLPGLTSSVQQDDSTAMEIGEIDEDVELKESEGHPTAKINRSNRFPNTRLFVAPIHANVSEQDIKTHFKEKGNVDVRSVTVAWNPRLNKRKKYVYNLHERGIQPYIQPLLTSVLSKKQACSHRTSRPERC